jgi:hypothetical protein
VSRKRSLSPERMAFGFVWPLGIEVGSFAVSSEDLPRLGVSRCLFNALASCASALDVDGEDDQ